MDMDKSIVDFIRASLDSKAPDGVSTDFDTHYQNLRLEMPDHAIGQLLLTVKAIADRGLTKQKKEEDPDIFSTMDVFPVDAFGHALPQDHRFDTHRPIKQEPPFGWKTGDELDAMHEDGPQLNGDNWIGGETPSRGFDLNPDVGGPMTPGFGQLNSSWPQYPTYENGEVVPGIGSEETVENGNAPAEPLPPTPDAEIPASNFAPNGVQNSPANVPANAAAPIAENVVPSVLQNMPPNAVSNNNGRMEVDPMKLCPQCGRAIFPGLPGACQCSAELLQPTPSRPLPKQKAAENTCEDCHKKCSKNAIRCRPCHNKRVAKEKAERHAAGTPMKKRGPKRKNDSPYVKW